MGALTINRKRSDKYYTLDCKTPLSNPPNVDIRIDTRISKKPRISPSPNLSPNRDNSSKSGVSKLRRYPPPVNLIRRQVHGPCRVSRLGFWASSNRRSEEGSVDVMGNLVSFRYDQVKNTYLKKDKEVIDVDEEDETERDGVSEDSSIEEAEFVEDEREETSGVVPNLVVSDSANGNLEVGNNGKRLEAISLEKKLDLLGYKELLETAERRNPKLDSLRFQIELNKRRRESLQFLHPAKRPEEEEEEEDGMQDLLCEAFLPLSEEEEAEVSRAFSNSNRRKVLVTHKNSNIGITGEVLQCLKPGKWLNDEVINVYLELLKEREKREPQKFLKCHFFNTFFYKKLFSGRNGYDFKSVRRWTTQRKLGYDLLDCDKIFVPIHKEVHWCLAVINKKDQKFQYLDSLGGIDSQVLTVLARYFVDEVKEKSGKRIDVSSWKQEHVEDLPEQENGWDCGVFMIKYSDFYSRVIELCFNQDHMPYFRRRTAKEILRLKAE